MKFQTLTLALSRQGEGTDENELASAPPACVDHVLPFSLREHYLSPRGAAKRPVRFRVSAHAASSQTLILAFSLREKGPDQETEQERRMPMLSPSHHLSVRERSQAKRRVRVARPKRTA